MLNRLARIEGQVRGLQRMIEAGQGLRGDPGSVGCRQIRSRPSGDAPHQPSHEGLPEDKTGAQLDPAALERAFDIFFKYVQCMK